MSTVYKAMILVNPIMLWLISTALAEDPFHKNSKNENDVAILEQNPIGTETNRGSDRIIVKIDADVLKSILTTKLPFTFAHENSTTSFFSEFKQFLVPFSWNEPEINDVTKVAAEYNKNQFSVYSTIRLWVSFQPRDHIRDDIKVVTDAIVDANSIFPGTVSTLVLDYNLLQLETQSLLLVNHEIGIVREKINGLPGELLSFALQLHLNNCRSKFLKNLDLLHQVDVVLLSEKRQLVDVIRNENRMPLMFAEYDSCLQFLLKNTLPALTTFMSIQINTENGLYAYDRNLSTKFINASYTKRALLTFWTEVENQSKVIDSSRGYDGMSEMSSGWISWMQKPVAFSRKHFGGVVSAERQTSRNILGNFQKVIIEINAHTSNTRKAIEHILRELLGHSNSTQGTEQNNGNRKKGMEIQVIIMITITKRDFEYNAKQVDNAVWAISYANQQSPGAITGILFDWMACSISEECSGYKNQNSNAYCSVLKMKDDILHLFDYTEAALEKILTKHAVQLGMCMDVEITFKIIRTTMFQGCEESAAGFAMEMTALKFVLLEDNLTRNGATKMFNIITSQFILFLNVLNEPNHHYVLYYVQIVGCNGNYSSVAQLAEYALLYEKLNTWAEFKNATLYMDATIENPETCGQRTYTSSPEKYCECGFWVSTNTSLDNLISSAIYIHNKKELALKLYEKSRKSRSSNEDTSPPRTPVNNQVLYWVLVTLLLFAVLTTVAAITLAFHYRSKYAMTREEVANFLKGRIQGSSGNYDLNKDENISAESEPYNSGKYELKPSSFKIDTSCCLGSGEFGKVFRGKIIRPDGTTESAVKVANTMALTKSHGGRQALFGLLSEIKILAFLGEHEHIVCLLGAFTAKLRKGEIAVFLEFCELGSLYKYLRSIHPDRQEAVSDADPNGISLLEIVTEHYTETQGNPLGSSMCDELYEYGRQIACGMQFLVSKNVVHADLATRNVLLTQEKVVKICDFGLSRRMYDYTEYVKSSQAPLPWRWMAPESLRRLIFNEKSDVWAFGILLWEIFTLGDEPYPGLSYQENFPAMLARGLQLPAPKYNVKQIYSVMKQCWNVNPIERPTFAELNVELNQVLEG